MSEHQCNRCNETLPVSEFYRTADGIKNQCKPCYNDARKVPSVQKSAGISKLDVLRGIANGHNTKLLLAESIGHHSKTISMHIKRLRNGGFIHPVGIKYFTSPEVPDDVDGVLVYSVTASGLELLK